jgi:hypothetical protein
MPLVGKQVDYPILELKSAVNKDNNVCLFKHQQHAADGTKLKIEGTCLGAEGEV